MPESKVDPAQIAALLDFLMKNTEMRRNQSVLGGIAYPTGGYTALSPSESYNPDTDYLARVAMRHRLATSRPVHEYRGTHPYQEVQPFNPDTYAPRVGGRIAPAMQSRALTPEEVHRLYQESWPKDR